MGLILVFFVNGLLIGNDLVVVLVIWMVWLCLFLGINMCDGVVYIWLEFIIMFCMLLVMVFLMLVFL